MKSLFNLDSLITSADLENHVFSIKEHLEEIQKERKLEGQEKRMLGRCNAFLKSLQFFQEQIQNEMIVDFVELLKKVKKAGNEVGL